MPLKNADLCKVCRTSRTRHPSGVCSKCRKRGEIRPQLCKVCHSALTKSDDGICYRCRIKMKKSSTPCSDEDVLKENIKQLKQMQFIMEERLLGKTFSQIADMMGTTKSSVYKKYLRVFDMLRTRMFSQDITEDS